MQKLIRFFDKLEDFVRGKLSHEPIVYAIIGGFLVVLFWRGVWDLADTLEKKGGLWAIIFSDVGSIVVSGIGLLATGLFVSFFIGDQIILSGIKREKKLVEKAETEVKEEEALLFSISARLDRMEKELREISEELCDRRQP